MTTDLGRTPTRVAALLAAHNRRELTLACLRSLQAQHAPDVTLDVFVLDDASTDGTGEQIAEQFPHVTLLHGDGQQYWNGGMRRAFAAAMAADYDHYLWMNDDTTLDDGALEVLLDTERRLRAAGRDPVIVVGSTRDPKTGELTYGGIVQPYRWRPLHIMLVPPGDEPRPCDTMNGNMVLISRAVAQRVGNVDPAFVQQMADLDYGRRARAAGCSVWIAPGTLGTCAPNTRPSPGERPLLDELRWLWSTKELKPGPWATYCRRYAGRLWPLFWLSPYLRRSAWLILARTPLRRS